MKEPVINNMVHAFNIQNVWFKELSPNIMITRNPNWST
jgi:hypothetical protein